MRPANIACSALMLSVLSVACSSDHSTGDADAGFGATGGTSVGGAAALTGGGTNSGRPADEPRGRACRQRRRHRRNERERRNGAVALWRTPTRVARLPAAAPPAVAAPAEPAAVSPPAAAPSAAAPAEPAAWGPPEAPLGRGGTTGTGGTSGAGGATGTGGATSGEPPSLTGIEPHRTRCALHTASPPSSGMPTSRRSRRRGSQPAPTRRRPTASSITTPAEPRATTGSPGEHLRRREHLRVDGHAHGPAAVTAWVNEEADYHYASNTCDAGQMCGHYTQIVWATTTKLGCAILQLHRPRLLRHDRLRLRPRRQHQRTEA